MKKIEKINLKKWCVWLVIVSCVVGNFSYGINHIRAMAATDPTLSATLTAGVFNSNTGQYTLSAKASGTATGTINYTFYCRRSDAGTNITAGYTAKFDGITDNPKETTACSYPEGSFTAKVIIERGTAVAEARISIMAGAPDDSVSYPFAFLSANPLSSAVAPNDVVLTATGLTHKGFYYVTFYCNRSDSGTDITPGYAARIPGSNSFPESTTTCSYPSAGTYTAKVIVEQLNFTLEGRLTITVNAPPTLSATLNANPTSGIAPLTTTLTATPSGTATGTLNYTFWWDCTNTSNSVSDVTAACGDPTNATFGAKYNAVSVLTEAPTHIYANAATFHPKVIIERDSAPPAMAAATVTVAAPPCNPLSPQTQNLPCPTGQVGQITQTRTSTCPGPTWAPWVTTQNTCAAPPSTPTPTPEPVTPTPTPSSDCTVSFEEGGESVKIKGSLVSDTICFKPREKGPTGYSVSIYSDAKVLNSSLPGFENLMKVIIGY